MAHESTIAVFEKEFIGERRIIHLMGNFEWRMASAWSQDLCVLDYDSDEKPDVPKEFLWKWLWSNYSVRWCEWLAKAGFPPARAWLRKAEVMVSNRMVLPNGKLHHWVMRNIDAAGMAKFFKVYEQEVAFKELAMAQQIQNQKQQQQNQDPESEEN